MATQLKEPEGIAFFSVKSGETHYCKLEPTIAAYINSSDMGINASRGQDFGWRLDPKWVKKVKEFRRDPMQMTLLSSRNNGQKPTTVQILYHLYGEQLRAYQEDQEENENPYEEQYQRDISTPVRRNAPKPQPVDEVPETVDDADLEPAEVDTDAAAEAATSDEPASEQVEEIPAGDGSSQPTKPATQRQKVR